MQSIQRQRVNLDENLTRRVILQWMEPCTVECRVEESSAVCRVEGSSVVC